MDDQLDSFNAEQRTYADDQDRALDYTIDMRCYECGGTVPSGELAALGCCAACWRVLVEASA